MDLQIPLLPISDRLPPGVVMIGAAIGLAALDLVGAVAAKNWAEHRTPYWFIAGALTMVVLFWFYASSLAYADLAVVTFGWIALLQVAVIGLDRFRYGVDISTGKWCAIAGILLLQGYLIFAPTGTKDLQDLPAASAPAHARAFTGQFAIPAQRTASERQRVGVDDLDRRHTHRFVETDSTSGIL